MGRNPLRSTMLRKTAFLAATVVGSLTMPVAGDQPVQTVSVPLRGDAVSDPLLILLRAPQIHRHLRLSEAQVREVDKLLEQVDLELWKLRDLQLLGHGRKAWQLVDQVANGVPHLLDPPQQARLGELVLQGRGLNALLWPGTAESLNLSYEQSEQLAQRFAEARRESGRAKSTSAGGAKTKSSGGTVRNAENRQREILAVLSRPQQEHLRRLCGTRYDLAGIPLRYARAPEPTGIEAWLNTEPRELKQLRGKVVILHFWTYGCINCIHNLPAYQDWQTRFASRGAMIVGVHTPETREEHQFQNVRSKVQKYEIGYPVAVDTRKETWTAWANHVWPAVYLIDKGGYVRYWWYGELNWQGAGGQKLFTRRIEELLAEAE